MDNASPVMYMPNGPEMLNGDMPRTSPMPINGNFLPMNPSANSPNYHGMDQISPQSRPQVYQHVPNMPQHQQPPQQRPMMGNINYMAGGPRPQQHLVPMPPYMVNGVQPNSPPTVYQVPPQHKYLPHESAPMTNGNGMYIPQAAHNQNGPHHPMSPPQGQMMSPAMYQKVPMAVNGYGPAGPMSSMQPQQQASPQMQVDPSNAIKMQTQQTQYYPIIQTSTAVPTKSAKKVSFEPGTKGESDSLSGEPINAGPPATVSPLTVTAIPTRVFNNSAIVKASAKAIQCNLCRKKHVIAPSIYCSDCEFYMSRFQPKV